MRVYVCVCVCVCLQFYNHSKLLFSKIFHIIGFNLKDILSFDHTSGSHVNQASHVDSHCRLLLQ